MKTKVVDKMKLVLPTKKYIESYYELVESSKRNNDYEELGNAALKINESFEEMIKRLKDRKIGKNIHKRDVTACVYWIIEHNDVVGTIDMRYKLNQDYFERFGHVAYYIKYEERNKKYASNALKLIIKKYKDMHTKKIFITCLENNVASKKVISNNNGVLEKTVYDKIMNNYISRYIIEIDK